MGYDITGAMHSDVDFKAESPKAKDVLAPILAVGDALKSAFADQSSRCDEADKALEVARRVSQSERRAFDLIKAALTAFELQDNAGAGSEA